MSLEVGAEVAVTPVVANEDCSLLKDATTVECDFGTKRGSKKAQAASSAIAAQPLTVSSGRWTVPLAIATPSFFFGNISGTVRIKAANAKGIDIPLSVPALTLAAAEQALKDLSAPTSPPMTTAPSRRSEPSQPIDAAFRSLFMSKSCVTSPTSSAEVPGGGVADAFVFAPSLAMIILFVCGVLYLISLVFVMCVTRRDGPDAINAIVTRIPCQGGAVWPGSLGDFRRALLPLHVWLGLALPFHCHSRYKHVSRFMLQTMLHVAIVAVCLDYSLDPFGLSSSLAIFIGLMAAVFALPFAGVSHVIFSVWYPAKTALGSSRVAPPLCKEVSGHFRHDLTHFGLRRPAGVGTSRETMSKLDSVGSLCKNMDSTAAIVPTVSRPTDHSAFDDIDMVAEMPIAHRPSKKGVVAPPIDDYLWDEGQLDDWVDSIASSPSVSTSASRTSLAPAGPAAQQQRKQKSPNIIGTHGETPAAAADVLAADAGDAKQPATSGSSSLDNDGDKENDPPLTRAGAQATNHVKCQRWSRMGHVACVALSLVLAIFVQSIVGGWCPKELSLLAWCFLAAALWDFVVLQPLFIVFVVLFRWMTHDDDDDAVDHDAQEPRPRTGVVHYAYPIHGQTINEA